jgi:chaperonin GroEL
MAEFSTHLQDKTGGLMDYQKVKSPPKRVMTPKHGLERVMLDTVDVISDVVGSTLGPGGRPVLLERHEYDSPTFVTKDGVTVFKALGFQDPVAHAIMETMRDSAARTAVEAGDGTTTAAVVGSELVKALSQYCKNHPTVSPQKAVRELNRLFSQAIEPALAKAATYPKLDEEGGKEVLKAVAKVSGNGDEELAKAVMECYEITGDAGHVSIHELSGSSHYEVEALDGFPITGGYEDFCRMFYPKFINEQTRQMAVLERPVFILYHGEITEPITLKEPLEMVGREMALKVTGQSEYDHSNVVVVATGFSEKVLGMFAINFADGLMVCPFPVAIPKNPFSNGQKQWLDDLAAVTGATVFDPLNKPLETATLEDYGPGVDRFEASRWKSMIFGRPDPDAVISRVADLMALAKKPESEMDGHFLNERIGHLSGGIAKLKVFGGSNAETRERRDRAEDAVCSVRGAIKRGCLPGGGWGLALAAAAVRKKMAKDGDMRELAEQVLVRALSQPLRRLLANCGLNREEVDEVSATVLRCASRRSNRTYDALAGKFVNAYKAGILDCLPAVVEAVKNGISAASCVGTMAAVVVYDRDREFERKEAYEQEAWKRDAMGEENPADERGA